MMDENHEEKVFVSYGLTGKMTGVPAVSTNTMLNPICRMRAKVKGSICAHCFAERTVKAYKNPRDRYTENFELLTSRLLEDEELPTIKVKEGGIARIESFGDVANVTQARNYIRLVKKNKTVPFGAWSKNPGIWAEAFKLEGKPRNLSFVLSTMFMDADPRKAEAEAKKWPFVDHVFSVYSETGAKLRGVKINCGAKSCLGCQRCYHRNRKQFNVYEALN